MLFRLMPAAEQAALVDNLAGHLGKARSSVQKAMVEHFTRADADYGTRVAAALGLGKAAAKPRRKR